MQKIETNCDTDFLLLLIIRDTNSFLQPTGFARCDMMDVELRTPKTVAFGWPIDMLVTYQADWNFGETPAGR